MNQCKIILHFLKSGGYSGAENVAVMIIVEMKKRYNYEGIYVSPSGDIDMVLEKHHIEHAVISESDQREYRRIINVYNPDVIHAHDFRTSVLVSQIKTSALKISHLHNNPPWIKKVNIKTLAYFWAAKKFNVILAVSGSVFEEYIFGTYIRNKSRIIGNPIDNCRICKQAEEAEDYTESDIIFLGRLSSPKNPFRFLEIVRECKKTKEDINAIMVGKGDLKEEIERCIRQKGLEKNVKLFGFKSNPYGYLKHAKVLCIPSDWEGFGLVIIEAFSLGIPVVGTPVGGIPQLVTNETGLLSMSVMEMGNEIIRLLSEPEYYAVKSHAAYQRALQLSNVDEYIRQFYEIYQMER